MSNTSCPISFLLRISMFSPAAFLHPLSFGSSWAKKAWVEILSPAGLFLHSHPITVLHVGTPWFGSQLEMPEEALHGNHTWDRMDRGGFRTRCREKDWKAHLGEFYFKSWFTCNLSPCLFCRISAPSHQHKCSEEDLQQPRLTRFVQMFPMGDMLNLANFYSSFSCPWARGLSKRHWLCVAFVCWPHWILLLQFCCPSHVSSLSEGE